MKVGLTLLSCAVLYTIIQYCLYGINAAINNGGLTLNSGEVLEINTTTPSVNHNYNASHKNSSRKSNYSLDSTHLVAVITFTDDVVFMSGSTVKVVGDYALSITSLNGSINIQTDINMTCGEMVLNKTCLGGYTQSAAEVMVGTDSSPGTALYKGLGPGSLNITEPRSPFNNQCFPGSSHGGTGYLLGSIFKAGPKYDEDDITSLLGGSGGSCLQNVGSVAGGGALELRAEKGTILINASIRASGQVSSNHSSYCSGGSGGLIRLKAKNVTIEDTGKLIVDGGKAHRPSKRYLLGGGAGGIIQIIAPEGSLAADTLSLKYGLAMCPGHMCPCSSTSGHLLVRVNETAIPIFNGSEEQWPSSFYSWPPTSSKSAAVDTTCCSATPAGSILTTEPSYTNPTVTPHHSLVSSATGEILPTTSVLLKSGSTTEQLVNQLKKDLQSIINTIENGNEASITAIREVLTKHQSLAATASLHNGIMGLCLDIFKGYQDIMGWVAEKYPNVTEEILRDILETASECLHKKNHGVWKQTRNMPNLMHTLEDIFTTVVNSSFLPEIDYTIWTKRAVAEVVKKDVNSLIEDIRIPNYLDTKNTSWKGASDFVLIPKETVLKRKNAQENYSYIVLLYKDVEDGMPNKPTNGNEDDDWVVSSFVMSCFLKLDEKPVYNLSPPALLTFKTLSAEEPERLCSYWNLEQSVWLTDGVQELKSNSSSSHAVCQTHHFTSFAILMQHRKIPLSKEDILALSIITYIGCGISTAALIITLIIFLSIESLSSERHKIHTNLVVALLLAHVLFLAGIKETSSKVLCKLIAVSLHYFFLTAFIWMLVEGLHLYLKVVQVFRTENIKMVYYYVFGWCFSIIPVVITLSMKPNSYGNSEVCWLSTEDGTIWAFVGPVIAIIAINCFVLGMVVKTVVSSASAVKSSDHEHVKAGIKGLFVLMPILGVGWVLGLFALNKGTIVFVYAFAIVNGFQGLLIFLLHCVFNSEVRQAFRRQREKHALSKENDSQYNASFSLSQSEDSGSKKFSNSNSFEKLKASISLKRKSTSKVVQVQPVSDSRDFAESSLQVKRAFQDKSASKLSVTNVQNESSFLNCPMESEGSDPPLIRNSRKKETTTKRNRQSRP